MKKSVIAGVFIALSFTTCSAIADSLALSLANDDAGKLQPILNDIYGNKHENRDDYSQGLFLGYSHDISDSSQLSLHIAQDIYSPSGSNKRHNTAVTGDRAFSAYTHTGIEWNSLANDWIRYRLGTDIGVIGPDAGGQKVQNKAHEIIGAEKYHAWDDQIENRYGYTVKGMLSMTPSMDILGANVGLYPEVSAVTGNLFQYVAYGATIAIGNDKTFNSDNGFGLLAPRGLMHMSDTSGFKYKIFAGMERRDVNRNYTLEGKTILTKQTTVSLNKTVDEYQVGATIGYAPVAFTLAFNKVTSEFKTGDDYSFINGAITFFF
ncbi:lipid A deacylase LpxR family protein [Escherichia albertii]|uniref:lipid A deacylase LpxR family protein n=1 Tax=Escherichia albertii TaxID=208962 RepID=UPI000CF6B14D|nr:lipid A deacylase LpxR family protein [Escherichia albertii]